MTEQNIQTRAAEIAQFLGIPIADAEARLAKGFDYQHQMVNDDFRRANPRTDEELLNWYRTTEQYIWELSAYHDDPGFNYSGMCAGIIERLKNEGARRVLCLGDGIGDLTLDCRRAGLDAVYHDLSGSRTAAFAESRYKQHTGEDLNYVVTGGWEPEIIAENSYAPFDAVISLDFLEHCPDVPRFVRAIFAALKPGGLFCANNAFDCGSGPDGSIPCHLTINDKYAHSAPHTEGAALWDHLLVKEIGFRQISSNWYEKPA